MVIPRYKYIPLCYYDAEGAPDGLVQVKRQQEVNRENVHVESTPHRICKTIRIFLLNSINNSFMGVGQEGPLCKRAYRG
jgi:hypothetical protein